MIGILTSCFYLLIIDNWRVILSLINCSTWLISVGFFCCFIFCILIVRLNITILLWSVYLGRILLRLFLIYLSVGRILIWGLSVVCDLILLEILARKNDIFVLTFCRPITKLSFVLCQISEIFSIFFFIDQGDAWWVN